MIREAGPIKHWSPSDVPVLNNCLHQLYKRKALAQYVGQSETANRGTEIHKGIEDFIKGDEACMPNLKSHIDYINNLQDMFAEGKVWVEEKWGFDRNWSVADYFSAWCRVKTDCYYFDSPKSLIIDDWKTGKKYGNEAKHRVQGQGYAIAGFMKFKQVENVQVNMRYVDQKAARESIMTSNYTRESIAPLIPIWTNRGMEITTMTEFPPSPFPSRCEFCPYRPWNPECPEDMQCQYGVMK